MIFLITLLAALYMGWSMGSNDAANCVGADIGSGDMKLEHGIIITCFFSLLGAILLGSNVIKTIGKGVVPINLLPKEKADLIALTSLLGAAIWVTIATYKKFPVSTSHSIVGAVWGVGLLHGIKAVNLKLFRDIVFAWAFTPVVSGIITYAVLSFILILK